MDPRLTHALSRHPAHLWVGTRGREGIPRLSTGCAALDAALGGGWPQGTLVELLAAGPGLGRLALLLPALADVSHRTHIAWLTEMPHAPALTQAGVDMSRVLPVDATGKHRLWAAERCLKSGICGVLVLEEEHRLADPMLRRLKLAAASSAAITFLLRSSSTAASPSPAALRLLISAEPHSATRRITVLKDGAASSRTIDLDPHATGH